MTTPRADEALAKALEWARFMALCAESPRPLTAAEVERVYPHVDTIIAALAAAKGNDTPRADEALAEVRRLTDDEIASWLRIVQPGPVYTTFRSGFAEIVARNLVLEIALNEIVALRATAEKAARLEEALWEILATCPAPHLTTAGGHEQHCTLAEHEIARKALARKEA